MRRVIALTVVGLFLLAPFSGDAFRLLVVGGTILLCGGLIVGLGVDKARVGIPAGVGLLFVAGLSLVLEGAIAVAALVSAVVGGIYLAYSQLGKSSKSKKSRKPSKSH